MHPPAPPGSPPNRAALLVTLVLCGLAAPFLAKPVHIDDANFLVLAQGAAQDPWRPHAIEINWQGLTQPAFEVLSNPPGIGWWLAGPVGLGWPVWALHLVVLAWLPLAVWGAALLARRLAPGREAVGALLVCGAPVAVWASTALTPDLPLLACCLAGLGGVVYGGSLGRRAGFAALAGSAALFRYSGMTMVPLVVLWTLLTVPGTARWRQAGLLGLAAAAPLALLQVHDVLAYGQSHLAAMAGFQGVATSPADVFRKLVAAMAMLGAGCVLPALCWTRARGAGAGAGVGVALGLGAAVWSGHTGHAMGTTVLATAAGGAVLGGGLDRGGTDRAEHLFLVTWLLGGLAFLLTLRFTATRYWLPFMAPAVLLGLRAAPSRQLVAGAVVSTLGLSMLLAVDDLELALAQQTEAAWVLEQADGESGWIAGHWGFQHHLEAAGWQPVEDDGPLPVGALVARSVVSWPQEPAARCATQETRRAADRWPGPRVHTAQGAANFHAFLVSAKEPVETYAPWGFGGDALDVVEVCRVVP